MLRPPWRCALQLSLVAVPLAMAGCAEPLRRDTFENISTVNTFYSQRPWLNFDVPPTKVPGGFKVTVYLSTPDTDLGVFGEGTIVVDVYTVDAGHSGETDLTHVFRRSYDVEQAAYYRVQQRSRLGHAYSLRVNWGDVELLGQEIMIVVSFERTDGVVIRSQPKYIKVPLKG